MTCIVGFIHSTGVYIGGDSAGVDGLDLRIRRDPKVFRRGEFVYGFTSSFRMGQILQHAFQPPEREPGQPTLAYIYGPWIEGVRTCLKAYGYARTENNVDSGGRFLVGYEGQLFEVESDFQIAAYHEPFAAVGCGADYALGALYALRESHADLDPRQQVTRALEVAEHFSAGVQGPFCIEVLPTPPAVGQIGRPRFDHAAAAD